MAIRDIVKDGDPQLRKKCRAVSDFNVKLHKLLDDMYDTMELADGVGLAAPQIGILRKAVVIDTGNVFIEAINPRICGVAGSQIGVEGCLSVEGVNCEVDRPMHVMAEYQDRYGKLICQELTGLDARAYCHELDHLEGVLFYDRKHTEEQE